MCSNISNKFSSRWSNVVAAYFGMVFFEERHAIDGYVTFSVDRKLVHVRVDWPFDVHENDRIQIANCFLIDAYCAAIGRLSERQPVTVPGYVTGEVRVVARAGDRVQMALVEARTERPTEFHTDLPVSRAQLLPLA